MHHISLVNKAHDIIRNHLYPGAVAVDATVGNGYDTLFLLRHIAPSGRVFGFDVQQKALVSTRSKIGEKELTDCLTLFHSSHAFIKELIPKQHHGNISACMFNLGYLPGSDKTIITQEESTVAALTAARNILSSSGIMTVVAYPGHFGGDQETKEVKNWCDQLNTVHFNVTTIYSTEHNDSAPRLFVIMKLNTS